MVGRHSSQGADFFIPLYPSINKISLHSPVDYAAEELKKYLRMMMPECSEIKIKYPPDADDGLDRKSVV